MKLKTTERGEVIQSKQVLDKGNYNVVTEVLPDGVLVADGLTRKLANPKKKNVKHLHLLPANVFGEGINYPWDKAFDDRVAHYLKKFGVAER